MANQSLVLQNITRSQAGSYTCVGSNREGNGESNSVQLEVQCEWAMNDDTGDVVHE